ncbi:hypothetical protein C8R46DRAFT_1135446 [Mycena filopes]|nr:hypothetical protein C8R46DRAFT_1135446 [Mycena filopes]
MPFNRLNEDVLVPILYLTDVYTILSLSRVGRHLRTIAYTKQLWVLVVNDLSQRGLIRPGDSWDTFSSEELVEEVRCAVVGPRTWNRGMEAAIQRQITIQHLGSGPQIAEFLHGGRYVLLKDLAPDASELQCWEVLPHRRLWVWYSSTHSVDHAKFNFSHGESNALILLLLDGHAGADGRIILLDLDLDTGKSSELFCLDHLAWGIYNPLLTRKGRHVDIFGCTIWLGSDCTLLLVDWCVRKFLLVTLNPGRVGSPSSALITRYLVLASYPAVISPCYVRIYCLASVRHIWKPLDGLTLDEPMTLETMDETFSRTGHLPITLKPPPAPTADTHYHNFPRVSVLESAVHQNAYTLVVQAYDIIPPEDTRPPPTRPTLFGRLLGRVLKRPKPLITQPHDICVDTRTQYRLALPTKSDPELHQPLMTSTLRWRRDTQWDPESDWSFNLANPSGYGIWRRRGGFLQSTEHIFFQGRNTIEHPLTLPPKEQGYIRNLPATTIHISDTGIVMVQSGSEVVLYWYQ